MEITRKEQRLLTFIINTIISLAKQFRQDAFVQECQQLLDKIIEENKKTAKENRTGLEKELRQRDWPRADSTPLVPDYNKVGEAFDTTDD